MARSRPLQQNGSEALDGLLQHPQLWRAGQLGAAAGAAAGPTIATGFPPLDEHLPGGGWPTAGLTELLLGTAGVGELRLLLPLIRCLSRQQSRWIAWVAPPFVPYAPALRAGGVDVRRLLVIRPPDHQATLWAMERASRSGACSLVLGWPDERQLKLTDTRRLQLAAREGRTLACLFRPERAAEGNSMAELRLRLTPVEADGVLVDICKRRGGWPVSALPLRFSEAPDAAAIETQLEHWRAWQRRQAPAANPLARPSSATRSAAGSFSVENSLEKSADGIAGGTVH